MQPNLTQIGLNIWFWKLKFIFVQDCSGQDVGDLIHRRIHAPNCSTPSRVRVEMKAFWRSIPSLNDALSAIKACECSTIFWLLSDHSCLTTLSQVPVNDESVMTDKEPTSKSMACVFADKDSTLFGSCQWSLQAVSAGSDLTSSTNDHTSSWSWLGR